MASTIRILESCPTCSRKNSPPTRCCAGCGGSMVSTGSKDVKANRPDRRRANRGIVEKFPMAVTDQLGNVTEAEVKNLSRTGCRIASDTIWPTGTVLRVEFIANRRRKHAAVVIRNATRDRSGNCWTLGVEFLVPKVKRRPMEVAELSRAA